MLIQILGSGCAKCRQLYDNTAEALKQTAVDANIEKVEKINEIMKFGVPFTPAIVVDGVVKAYGKVLSVDEIKGLLT